MLVKAEVEEEEGEGGGGVGGGGSEGEDVGLCQPAPVLHHPHLTLLQCSGEAGLEFHHFQVEPGQGAGFCSRAAPPVSEAKTRAEYGAIRFPQLAAHTLRGVSNTHGAGSVQLGDTDPVGGQPWQEETPKPCVAVGEVVGRALCALPRPSGGKQSH